MALKVMGSAAFHGTSDTLILSRIPPSPRPSPGPQKSYLLLWVQVFDYCQQASLGLCANTTSLCSVATCLTWLAMWLATAHVLIPPAEARVVRVAVHRYLNVTFNSELYFSRSPTRLSLWWFWNPPFHLRPKRCPVVNWHRYHEPRNSWWRLLQEFQCISKLEEKREKWGKKPLFQPTWWHLLERMSRYIGY